MNLSEGKKGRLEVDQVAYNGGHDSLQDRKPGADDFAGTVVQFDQVGEQEHRCWG